MSFNVRLHMGKFLDRHKHRKAASWSLDALFKNAKHSVVIHYSCESFYDRVDGRTPRITSIAVRELESAQTRSFSIHKVAELKGVNLADIADHYDMLER